jgi:fumarate hydratase class I
VIAELGVRAVIGKGGMGDLTLGACGEHGAVYLHAVGGAASLIAQRVVEVEDVYKTEFGLPEAFWRIRVEDFQCVVTMDSHGGSLHKEVLAASRESYDKLFEA